MDTVLALLHYSANVLLFPSQMYNKGYGIA